MELEHSGYLNKISDEAVKAAHDYIVENENIVALLTNAESAKDVDTHREEILAASGDFFQERGIKIAEGKKALTSALISVWAELHPLDKAAK